MYTQVAVESSGRFRPMILTKKICYISGDIETMVRSSNNARTKFSQPTVNDIQEALPPDQNLSTHEQLRGSFLTLNYTNPTSIKTFVVVVAFCSFPNNNNHDEVLVHASARGSPLWPIYGLSAISYGWISVCSEYVVIAMPFRWP